MSFAKTVLFPIFLAVLINIIFIILSLYFFLEVLSSYWILAITIVTISGIDTFLLFKFQSRFYNAYITQLKIKYPDYDNMILSNIVEKVNIDNLNNHVLTLEGVKQEQKDVKSYSNDSLANRFDLRYLKNKPKKRNNVVSARTLEDRKGND